MTDRSVLVIEDDPDVREMLVDVLEAEGYAVSQAQDGWEGLNLAEEQQPNLILLDLLMPRMNGWEFRAAQMKNTVIAAIPVIVISGAPADPGGMLSGVAARFDKPFDTTALMKAVKLHASS